MNVPLWFELKIGHQKVITEAAVLRRSTEFLTLNNKSKFSNACIDENFVQFNVQSNLNLRFNTSQPIPQIYLIIFGKVYKSLIYHDLQFRLLCEKITSRFAP